MKMFNYLLAFSLVFTFFCCSNSSNYKEKQQLKEEIKKELSEEELKEQLKQKECANPSNYIEGKLGYNKGYKNAISLKYNRIDFHCTIKNNATLATFKNVKFIIKFLSKTKAVVIEKEFTIFDYLEPNSSLEYKNEIQMSNTDVKSVVDMEWYILGAECN